jgi:hypothetical protein
MGLMKYILYQHQNSRVNEIKQIIPQPATTYRNRLEFEIMQQKVLSDVSSPMRRSDLIVQPDGIRTRI